MSSQVYRARASHWASPHGQSRQPAAPAADPVCEAPRPAASLEEHGPPAWMGTPVLDAAEELNADRQDAWHAPAAASAPTARTSVQTRPSTLESHAFGAHSGLTPSLSDASLGVSRTDHDWSDPFSTPEQPGLSSTRTASLGRQGLSLGQSTKFRLAEGEKAPTASVMGSWRSDGTLSAGGDYTGMDGVTHSVRGSGHFVDGSQSVAGGYTMATPSKGGVGNQAFAGVNGSAGASVSEPRQTEDGWVLDFSSHLAGALTGGAKSARKVDTGAKLGVSGHVQYQAERANTGRRVFATKEEAEAFRETALPAANAGVPWSADGALELTAGESRGTRISTSTGIRGSTSMEATHAGGGVGWGSSVEAQVESFGDGRVRVVLDRSGAGAADVRGGAGFLSLDADYNTHEGERQAWILDLSTEGGRAAYHQVVIQARPPQVGPGVTDAGSDRQERERLGMGTNLAGHAIRSGTERTGREARTQEGLRISERGGAAFEDIDFGTASYEASQGVTAGTHSNDRGGEVANYLVGRGRVQGGNAAGTFEILGETAGTWSTQAREVTPTPGAITLDVRFGEDSLDRLVELAQDPDFEPDALKHKLSRGGLQLVQALRAAGGNREQQIAAVETFGTHGTAALDDLRSLLGRGDAFVRVEDSPVWIGKDGHDRVQRELDDATSLAQRAPDSANATFSRVAEDQRIRIMQLQDHGLYQDIPDSLRETEIKRTRRLVKRAEDGLKAGGVSPRADGADQAFEAFLNRVDKVYASARQAQEEHGFPGFDAQQTLRGRVGDEGLFDVIGRGPAADAYDRADQQLVAGEAERRQAVDHHARSVRANREADPKRGRELSELATECLTRALVSLRSATVLYTAIEDRYGSR